MLSYEFNHIYVDVSEDKQRNSIRCALRRLFWRRLNVTSFDARYKDFRRRLNVTPLYALYEDCLDGV